MFKTDRGGQPYPGFRLTASAYSDSQPRPRPCSAASSTAARMASVYAILLGQRVGHDAGGGLHVQHVALQNPVRIQWPVMRHAKA